MFGKTKSNSSAATITKDINESIKTLSYLARAEKYFDLELKKNGQTTKPLLKIVDIIEPLRNIGETTQKLGKGQKLPDGDASRIFAGNQISQIIEVANDILALNPKGLVSSDKTALSKLDERLTQASKLAGVPYSGEKTEETLLPKTKRGLESAAQKAADAEAAQTATNENIAEAPTATSAQDNEDLSHPDDAPPEPVRSDRPSAAGDWPQEELKRPLQWENRATASSDFRRIEEPSPFAPEPQPQAQNYNQPAPTASYAPQEEQYEETTESQPTQSQKVVPLKQARKEVYNLPQKYFATSYAGMNLQEAAEIISDLVNNPANLEIVMLEHASRVKPVAEGREIIGDLLAIAPIADSFETGTEINDKKHLSVLKDADRIISICKDIANVKIEGFDRRKQKLFEKFIPEDIKKTVELAKIAYPEVFSTGDVRGDVVSDILLDLSDIFIAHSEESGDKLFGDLLSQVVTQIVLYAEHNDLRLKFDVVSKKHRLNSTPQPLNSRSEVAVLRAITFVPKIARQAQDILLSNSLGERERDMLTKSLEILQMAYVHARDNYSAEISSFYDNKAA